VLGGAVLGAAAVVSNLVSFKAELERTNPGVKVVETVEEARAEVRHQRALGYDLIKPYDYSRPEVYEAICREAHVLGMYAAGHLNDELTAQQALEAGLDEFAHVDELMHVHMSGQVSPNSGFEEVSFNYATIPETVAAIKSHDAFVVSNLVADETSYLMLEDVEGQLSKDMYRVVQPEALQSWKTEGRAVAWQGQQDWRRNVLQPFLKALVKALHEAGVPLLLGTDVSVEGMIPWHLHRDLELLVDAGLTPFEALTAGTKNAALSFTRMGKNGDFGTVEVGKLADLILVEGNPLEDVSATQHRVGVMKRGRWYPKTELDALVTAYVARQSEL
jgi:imidazolonepropionase-like amidohydrolase